MKQNNYWKEYKKHFNDKWHFDPKNKIAKDFIFIKNIKHNYKKMLSEIEKIETKRKKATTRFVVTSEKKFNNKKLNIRINAIKEWGYKKEQTRFTQIFSSENPKLFDKFIKISKLSNATASIIKQYPGNILPWHYDTHVTFKNLIKKNKELKNKKVIRYMMFLTDWHWGHHLGIGNNIIHQWKAGDMITWEPHMHHCGSNSGMIPKITLNITGFIESNSLHIKKVK
tara:strand:+ start:375 stop:1052 length:678 start_codon:yes stop_codon:yes gene_type:complete